MDVRARGTAKASTRCCRTPTSATSRCSSRCPTAGPSSSCSRSCRSTGSNERPTQHAVLGDITCDSDGKIDQFIDRRDVKTTLPLHTFNGEPYYLGRVPGRRLPGNPRRPAQPVRRHQRRARRASTTTATSCSTTSSRATRCSEVLDYVEFDVERLIRQLRTDVEAAVRDGASTRGSRPAPALLRGRAARLHVPGGAAPH